MVLVGTTGTSVVVVVVVVVPLGKELDSAVMVTLWVCTRGGCGWEHSPISSYWTRKLTAMTQSLTTMHLLLAIAFFGFWSMQQRFSISGMIVGSIKKKKKITSLFPFPHHQMLQKKGENKRVSVRQWMCLLEEKTECQSSPSPEWELCIPPCNASAAATYVTHQPSTIHSNYTSFLVLLVWIWNGAAKEWASVAALKSCRGQAKDRISSTQRGSGYLEAAYDLRTIALEIRSRRRSHYPPGALRHFGIWSSVPVGLS